jgi:hypothetical protein
LQLIRRSSQNAHSEKHPRAGLVMLNRQRRLF